MMICAACHSKMEEKTGALDLRIRGDLYMVKNVVYEECGVCGEKTVSPEVSQMVYEKIKNKQYVEEKISVPVLDFAAA